MLILLTNTFKLGVIMQVGNNFIFGNFSHEELANYPKGEYVQTIPEFDNGEDNNKGKEKEISVKKEDVEEYDFFQVNQPFLNDFQKDNYVFGTFGRKSAIEDSLDWDSFDNDLTARAGHVDNTARAGHVNAAAHAESIDKLVHQNWLFGAYCGEDLRAIYKLLKIAEQHNRPKELKKNNPQKESFDCFNLETKAEICSSHEALDALYNKNFSRLTKLNKSNRRNKIDCKIHYEEKPNDLTKNGESWEKDRHAFAQNMIFFNPFGVADTNDKKELADIAEITQNVVTHFFKYAASNLEKDGVVTMMWNRERKDALKKVNIKKIAAEQGFSLIRKKLPGKKFAKLTGFVHTRNGATLKKGQKATVELKNTDTIFMFKRKADGKIIPKDNRLARAFSQIPVLSHEYREKKEKALKENNPASKEFV